MWIKNMAVMGNFLWLSISRRQIMNHWLHAKFGTEIDFGLIIAINCVRNIVCQKLQIHVWL